jgi:TolB protein
MNRDGSNIRRIVARTDGPVVSPTWSPDGAKIAYQSGHSATLYDIYVINADGTNKVNLTANLGATDQLSPSWSPALGSGSRIAFVHRANGSENVWTMRPDGTDRRQITTGILDEFPSWSPNGATIVFSRTNAVVNGDLHLVDANGQNVRPVMPFVSLAGPQWYPVFSPDGRMIAFSSQHETWSSAGEFQIFTVWTDGSKLARRTTSGGMWPAFVPR